MSSTDAFVANAERYAAAFEAADLPTSPATRAAVVACMDARLNPYGLLGLAEGDAHVIRNAGGVVTEDVIRSLTISQRLLGTTEIVLIHHTDCGMLMFRDDDVKAQIEADTGLRPPFALEAFPDLDADVRQSIARIKASPYLSCKDSVRGFVYEVATGRLREVTLASSCVIVRYRGPVTTVTETDASGVTGSGPRHLIITVYGLYARSEGGWLSVAALIRLLADLGVDEPAVRSAISRLKRRGILQSRRHEGSAGYQLSAQALAILREGDTRIFRRDRATLADGWLLAVFSVPEAERHRRHVLRSELTRLGFGMVAPGIWIAPAHPHDATAATLRRLGLDSYADLFHADHLAFGDLADKIRRWWDLDELERLYQAFIAAHEPTLRLWRDGEAAGGRRAFDDYVRALTDWRRLPYLDPGLPAELLPPGWTGIRAADTFFALRSRLEEPAREYVSGLR